LKKESNTKYTSLDSINRIADSLVILHVRDTSYYYDFVQRECRYRKLALAIIKIENEQPSILDTLYKYYSIGNYFKLFNLLKMDSTLRLDYFYPNFKKGGLPVLLALNGNENKKNFEQKEFADNMHVFNKIHVEDSELGYFQFVVFISSANLFAVTDYMDYNSLKLYTSKKDINQLINHICPEKEFQEAILKEERSLKVKLKDKFNNVLSFLGLKYRQKYRVFIPSFSSNCFYPHFLANEQTAFDTINYTPKIKLFTDTAEVKVMIFCLRYGIEETIFHISRKYPHKFKQTREFILPCRTGGIYD
jgi:hypothetical protein